MLEKEHLYEIDFIRPILICQLVICHAFIIYTGGWAEPKGFHGVYAYWWLDKSVYSFMLESFVLISGYIYGFQLLTKKKYLTLNKSNDIPWWKKINIIFFSKVKRLILPSIIFSIIYFLLFMDYRNFWNMFYSILNGVGHMWFLPMLFWCFILASILFSINIADKSKLLLCFLITSLSFLPMPFRIGLSFYYLLFFYIGIVFYKNREQLIHIFNVNKILILWMFYIITFIFGTLITENILNIDKQSIIEKAVYAESVIFIKLIYSAVGSITFLLTALKFTQNYQLSKFLIQISPLCFGVYLFQQFIIQTLYYKIPSFYSFFGTYFAPCVATVVTLILSILLTQFFLKFKIGKKIIG